MRGYILLVFLLVVVFCTPMEADAQGCSMCKAVVESESGVFGGKQSIGAGLNTGILYLMAVPYLLLFLLFRKRLVAFFKEIAGSQG